MAQVRHYTIKNNRRVSYLIADSEQYGKDQIISGTIKYNSKGLYDRHNERIINEARNVAQKDGFTNVRIVTTYYDAICIHCGVVSYKKSKETIKPFKFD